MTTHCLIYRAFKVTTRLQQANQQHLLVAPSPGSAKMLALELAPRGSQVIHCEQPGDWN